MAHQTPPGAGSDAGSGAGSGAGAGLITGLVTKGRTYKAKTGEWIWLKLTQDLSIPE